MSFYDLSVDGKISSFSWHPSHAKLATGSDEGVVQILSEDADIVSSMDCPRVENGAVAKLSWHPSKNMLAVAWNKGSH